jgi:hypothetical protein
VFSHNQRDGWIHNESNFLGNGVKESGVILTKLNNNIIINSDLEIYVACTSADISKTSFEIVFSRHFETFGEAIAEIEKHFGSSDFEPESEVKNFLTSQQFLQILSLAAISIPAIILLIFSI